MKYLLDTCVISEFVKKQPDKRVEKWFSEIPEYSLFLSVLTIGEIRKGVEKLPEGQRKDKLYHWVVDEIPERFENRILYIDMLTAQKWGEIQGQSEMLGKPLSLIDGLIAATAVMHTMVLVTRNTKDMEASGATLLNPWDLTSKLL